MANYKELLTGITTFIFDYDGVMTDGSVITTNDGEPLRITNVKDGYALQLARKKGYNVAVISGAKSRSMEHRLKMLQVEDVFLGVEIKKDVFLKYLKDNEIDAREVLYMGDDIPDFEVMQLAGVSACPADAAEEIKSVSKYISHFPGGKGCVRDVIEQVMKVHGKWMNDGALHW
jgi:3-deoxy-D-manno-octulosonate 8-phosphate phosphatase (KDO 8-P phosphatase)